MILKNIKRFAIGTMTTALSFMGPVSMADRLDLGVSAGVNGFLGGEPEIFRGGKTKKDTDGKDADLGFTDLCKGFRSRIKLGYSYSVNEYFGIGASFVLGGYKQWIEVSDAKLEMAVVQPGGSLDMDIYPLGDQTFILGVSVCMLGNFGVDFTLSTDTDEKIKKATKENTGKALGKVAVGLVTSVGYDLREIMDFPLKLGVELGGYYTYPALFDTKDAGKCFGADFAKDTKSPQFQVFCSGVVAIDMGYFFL